MLRSVSALDGFIVTTTEGDVAGRVEQLYFDDEEWKVRYLVVETGGWMSGRKVLISPAAFEELNRGVRVIRLSLTKEQIENSPDIDTDKPVSRQREAEISKYYRWPLYWGDPLLWGVAGYPAHHMAPPSHADRHDGAGTSEAKRESEEDGSGARAAADDTHLRSTKEVIGYHIEAADGPLGHVEDFLFDEGTWAVRYVVVDTANWWPGKKVLASSRWINRVSWAESKVYLDLEREAIKSAPEYDPASAVGRVYEAQLHKHYRRTPYWVQGRRGLRGTRSKAAPRAEAAAGVKGRGRGHG